MAYDKILADSVRKYLNNIPKIKVEEKEMFGGLAFMVNDKMCVNVSGQNLMCRFDKSKTEKLSRLKGFVPMTMKGKVYKGYCYVEPIGLKNNKDLEFWILQCLDFNKKAKSSKKDK